MTTTTSSARARPTRKRACGSRTRPSELRESKGSDPLVAAEPGQLETLMEWGLGYESRADSRLDALVSFLDAVCRPDGKHWSNERVVVFTEYAHTVDWLTRVLNQRG